MKNYFKGERPVDIKININEKHIYIYSGIYQKPVKVENRLKEDEDSIKKALCLFEKLNGIKVTGK
jgi:hypothetical protein